MGIASHPRRAAPRNRAEVSALEAVRDESTAADCTTAILYPSSVYAVVPTLLCGQVFRFGASGTGTAGVCGSLALHVASAGPALRLTLSAGSGSLSDAARFLGVADNVQDDAAESCAYLCAHYPDSAAAVREVFACSEGLHLLHQPTVETVVGYVLSVQSSVELVGRRLNAIASLFPANRRQLAGRSVFLFPGLAELRSLEPADLERLHLGYRSAWLRDLIAGLPEEDVLEQLREECPEERRRFFRKFTGIGPKVCSCIDLFVYGNDDAFPVDVWVDRGLRRVLGFSSRQVRAVVADPSVLGPHCGLFGEYLFRYERNRSVRLGVFRDPEPGKRLRSEGTG